MAKLQSTPTGPNPFHAMKQKAHDQRVIHSSKEPNYRTPPALYQALHMEFDFCIDLAATAANALAVRPDRENDCGVPCYLGPDHVLPECRDALDIGFPLLSAVLAQRRMLPVLPAGFVNPPYSRELERAWSTGKIKVDGEWLSHPIDKHVSRSYNVASWAERCWEESQRGLTIVGLFPAAQQTSWWRRYVLGVTDEHGWAGHSAMEVRTIPHRVSFLSPTGEALDNAGVNHAIIIWKPRCGYVGPWTPVFRLWDYQ